MSKIYQGFQASVDSNEQCCVKDKLLNLKSPPNFEFGGDFKLFSDLGKFLFSG